MQREVPLTPRDYGSFAFSGAACTAIVRTTLMPLEVTYPPPQPTTTPPPPPRPPPPNPPP